MRFLSEGINDHENIFTRSFVWFDILLFSLVLDVVFLFQLMLVIREQTNNARKKSRFSQYYSFYLTRMSLDDESDPHVVFPRKYISWSGKVNTDGAWNLCIFS